MQTLEHIMFRNSVVDFLCNDMAHRDIVCRNCGWSKDCPTDGDYFTEPCPYKPDAERIVASIIDFAERTLDLR